MNKKQSNLNSVVRCLTAFLLIAFYGCVGMPASTDGTEESGSEETTEGTDGSSESVESPGKNVEYTYVAPYDGDTSIDWAIADILSYYGNRVLSIDPEKNYPIDWENEESIPDDYDPDEIASVKEEDGNPDYYGCVIGTGTSLPEMDESWSGYGKGGCGTWSTAVCNRILGDSDGEVTRGEWNGIAEGIGQDADGGSTMSNQSKYYEDKGYCVTEKKFGGSEADYQEMEDQIQDQCDVKLLFWTRNEDGTFSNGHVETVTSADGEGESCTTNSWGEEATVNGGNDGDFEHSRDGSAFQDDEGNKLWPEDATEVWVQYVCECSVLESIGKLLGF